MNPENEIWRITVLATTVMVSLLIVFGFIHGMVKLHEEGKTERARIEQGVGK